LRWLWPSFRCATRRCWFGWRWETVHLLAVVAAGWSWGKP